MSLINDALKRASEAQREHVHVQRGPKGLDDLPPPVMSQAAGSGRRQFVPAMALAAVVIVLFVLSGFFFFKWWQGGGQPKVPEGMDKLESRIISEDDFDDYPPGQEPKSRGKAVKVARVQPAPAPPVPSKGPEPAAKTPGPPVPVSTPPKAISVVTPEPPPVTPVVEPEPAPPPKKVASKGGDAKQPEFPPLKLQGIIYRKTRPSAFINGKTLYVGDQIDSAELIEIDLQYVTFELSGRQRKYFLLR